MNARLETDFAALYEESWKTLHELRRSCTEIDRECTPILVFGEWRKSRLVTAGLNPSEDEFRDKNRIGKDGWKAPLEGGRQRFVHWPKSGLLTRDLREEAFRRAEGYFTLGNVYKDWFGAYNEFLSAMEMPFASGEACHTDYVSPFATVEGVSKCTSKTIANLKLKGFPYWVRMLELCPRLDVIFGHGHGWREVERYFRITLVDLVTPFDHKGGQTRHLSTAFLWLPRSNRRVLVYWWHPNRDGLPICFLSRIEKSELGEILKKDMQKRISN